MKTLLTPLMLSLLAMTVVSPAMAAGGGVGTGQDYPGASLIGIVGPQDSAWNALNELKAADDDQAILIGMLLPAIQKVRDAANRSASACPSDPKEENNVDLDCAAEKLSEMILDSQTGRDGSPGLLNLALKGTGGTHIKEAKLFVRKQGTEGAPGAEKMVIAILIGLLREVEKAKITDGDVLKPLRASIEIADGIDPSHKSAKPTSSGYDLVMGKKA